MISIMTAIKLLLKAFIYFTPFPGGILFAQVRIAIWLQCRISERKDNSKKCKRWRRTFYKSFALRGAGKDVKIKAAPTRRVTGGWKGAAVDWLQETFGFG
jgi:hypothetical protein